MSKLDLNLKGVNVETESKTNFVPAGNYVSRITETEVKPTKSGHALVLYFTVMTGDQEGSKFKDFLNVVNASEKAQTISLSRLKTIATYIGHKNPNLIADSDELVGGVVEVHVVEDTWTNDSGDNVKTNKVKGYRPVDTTGAVTSNVPSGSGGSTPTDSVPPWARK